MEAQQAGELLDWFWMVVNTQVQESVVEAAVAAARLDDDERGGLLPPAVPTGRLPRPEGRNEPDRELLPLRALECGCHGVHRLAADQDVALASVIRAGTSTRPGEATGAGVGCRPAEGVHHADLPRLAIRVIR